jgi:hypothetical protein
LSFAPFELLRGRRLLPEDNRRMGDDAPGLRGMVKDAVAISSLDAALAATYRRDGRSQGGIDIVMEAFLNKIAGMPVG